MRGNADPSGARRVLFLQGPLSPLFRLIGDHIRQAGQEVHRINFCAGDWLHWHGAGCVSYKRQVDAFAGFIDRFLDRHQITDLVLHGDQRVYHRIAVDAARRRGLYIAVTELGYLRPGWMTLEKNGLSTLSHFPDDPAAIRRIAEAAGEIDFSPRYPSSFWLQTGPDVIYNLTNVFVSLAYPHYQRHTLYPPVMEYLRGGWRLLRAGARDRTTARQLAALHAKNTRYFVLPMQLEGDFQLRRHSPFESFANVIDTVFRSLSEHGEKDLHLVLKSHPLDVGYENWPQVVDGLAGRYGLDGRVHYLDGGRLDEILARAEGVVTLNSTAGLEALQMGLPVKTLVPAHFDIAGLTHSGDLGSFWGAPHKPDADLLSAYIKAIAATIQVRGSIHNADGLPVAAKNIADRILNRQLNEPGGFVDPPPRLERARALGVPL
ncbi:MAG: capsular biosynthesis protein [Roseibium sp.]|nr:capsular biosynthesis protein [Roseibium sp.]